jgi:hypothetical protein
MLIDVCYFALIVKFWILIGKVMNFSTIFTFEATLAQEIGTTKF